MATLSISIALGALENEKTVRHIRDFKISKFTLLKSIIV